MKKYVYLLNVGGDYNLNLFVNIKDVEKEIQFQYNEYQETVFTIHKLMASDSTHTTDLVIGERGYYFHIHQDLFRFSEGNESISSVFENEGCFIFNDTYESQNGIESTESIFELLAGMSTKSVHFHLKNMATYKNDIEKNLIYLDI